jgi:hypothetical protein
LELGPGWGMHLVLRLGRNYECLVRTPGGQSAGDRPEATLGPVLPLATGRRGWEARQGGKGCLRLPSGAWGGSTTLKRDPEQTHRLRLDERMWLGLGLAVTAGPRRGGGGRLEAGLDLVLTRAAGQAEGLDPGGVLV